MSVISENIYTQNKTCMCYEALQPPYTNHPCKIPMLEMGSETLGMYFEDTSAFYSLRQLSSL